MSLHRPGGPAWKGASDVGASDFFDQNVIILPGPSLFCSSFIQRQCVWRHNDRAGEQPPPEFAPCYLAARA
jgi:hypothetical protein